MELVAIGREPFHLSAGTISLASSDRGLSLPCASTAVTALSVNLPLLIHIPPGLLSHFTPFSSSGGWGGGTELACQSLLTVLMNFGFLVFGVTDYAGKLTTAHYGAIAARDYCGRGRLRVGGNPVRLLSRVESV